METEKVKEILRSLCKYRVRDCAGNACCLNRVYGSVEKCECQCLQDIFYDYEDEQLVTDTGDTTLQYPKFG